ncbi:MAG: AtpZ/AtpI family protein [Planctomycetes bacterium]|nr:AtpZ/AtpI family protein [Planctomycetota bacterium]
MATRIMTISLEMVLPGLAGYWLDQRLGTVALFMLVGFALGCTATVFHLIHLTRSSGGQKQTKHPLDKN